MKIEEEITNAAGNGAIAGLGVGPQGEPGRNPRKRGKFAGNPTFIVSRQKFLGITEAKRKGKHWRKYLDEDEAYHDVRDYAYSCDGPIIVEDEATGHCAFVRYGKKSLFEAEENNVKNTKEWRRALGDAGKDARDVRADAKNNYGKEKFLGKFKGHYVRKTSHDKEVAYHLQNPKTKKITHSVNGYEKKGVLDIHGAGSTGKSSVKMHDFYHHLIKKHVKALVGTSHSPGAKKVWQRLAKKQGVSLHGHHKGKAVNLDPQDEMETHAPRQTYPDNREPEEKTVAATKLVASYHKKGAKKL
jgi:hypothetical protein